VPQDQLPAVDESTASGFESCESLAYLTRLPPTTQKLLLLNAQFRVVDGVRVSREFIKQSLVDPAFLGNNATCVNAPCHSMDLASAYAGCLFSPGQDVDFPWAFAEHSSLGPPLTTDRQAI
jgi:hypothetical protein